MSEQLSLGLEAPERRYSCCGADAGPVPRAYTLGGRDDDPDRPKPWHYPHTEDCKNPNIGVWITRDNRTIRRLHCVGADGGCPTGGRFVASEGVHDPHGGRCCLELRREATA